MVEGSGGGDIVVCMEIGRRVGMNVRYMKGVVVDGVLMFNRDIASIIKGRIGRSRQLVNDSDMCRTSV